MEISTEQYYEQLCKTKGSLEKILFSGSSTAILKIRSKHDWIQAKN